MKGHLLALIAITIWSLTYIQTKVLLAHIDPIEILMVRFSLAWAILWIIYPKRVPIHLRDETWFMLAGLSGIFGYYVLENIALIHTTAINVGLLVTLAPLLTLLIASRMHRMALAKEALWGALIAFVGVLVLVFDQLSLPKIGDTLALLGALSFAIYSIVLGRIPSAYHYLAVTRKSIFYGLVFLWLFWSLLYSGSFHLEAYAHPTVLINLGTLTLFASVGAFILWRRAVMLIGSTKTSNYIYLVPLINTTASVWVLNEALGWRVVVSSVLILGGLIMANRRSHQLHE
jgi:drug/metabolite transporter (DMT)-like permease